MAGRADLVKVIERDYGVGAKSRVMPTYLRAVAQPDVEQLLTTLDG